MPQYKREELPVEWRCKVDGCNEPVACADLRGIYKSSYCRGHTPFQYNQEDLEALRRNGDEN